MSTAEKCPKCGTIMTSLEKHLESFCPACRGVVTVGDHITDLGILAAAWARIPADVRAAALASLVADPGPRKGWMEEVLQAIDADEIARKDEREACAKLIDAAAQQARERSAVFQAGSWRQAKLAEDRIAARLELLAATRLELLAADIRARNS